MAPPLPEVVPRRLREKAPQHSVVKRPPVRKKAVLKWAAP
jgi:hypothetical protein